MDLLIALGVWATIVLSATWLLERRPATPSPRDRHDPAPSRPEVPFRRHAAR